MFRDPHSVLSEVAALIRRHSEDRKGARVKDATRQLLKASKGSKSSHVSESGPTSDSDSDSDSESSQAQPPTLF